MTTSADRGRSARGAGTWFENRLLKLLQMRFPGAYRTHAHHCGDYGGVGDIILDATTDRWARLGETDDAESSKIWQARRDAKETGYQRWVIAKRGGEDEGFSIFWVEDFNTGLAAYAELLELREKADRLDQLTMEADESYDRGFIEGVAKTMRQLGTALRGEEAAG